MSMSDDLLAAAESLMDEEFNSGISEPAEEVVEPAEAPAGDTPALVFDDGGRPRTADGRFASVQDPEETPVVEPEEAPAAPAEPTAEEEPPAPEEPAQEPASDDELVFEIDDPDILAYLQKYDGDALAALKAATEAQSLIGRQGQELGQTRQENEQLKAMADQLKAMEARLATNVPYRHDVDEDPQGLVQEVLERMAETGVFDERTYTEAIQAWGEEDPFQAASVDARVQMARAVAQQAIQESVEVPQNDLAQEMGALRQRHPDLDAHLPAVEKILAERPHWQAAVSQGDPSARAQALEDIVMLAKSQSQASDTSAAVTKLVLRAKAEADKAKTDAAVLGATNSTVPTPPKNPDAALASVLSDVFGGEIVIE